MAFQWVFDNAQSISGNNRALVGKTITRNQTYRAVSRGNAIQRFTVRLPDGMRWSDIADEIALIDTAGEATPENIELSNVNYIAWMHNGDFTPGQNWNMYCESIPEWEISARNIVTWKGSFVFVESI